jgi:hypothetical protein
VEFSQSYPGGGVSKAEIVAQKPRHSIKSLCGMFNLCVLCVLTNSVSSSGKLLNS